MRKLIVVLALFIVLTGCTSNAYFDNKSYDKALLDATNQTMSEYSTMNRDLFSYYIPPSIGRKSATENSVTLRSHNQNILMYLDVINILNLSYYREESQSIRKLLKTENAFYTANGFYQSIASTPIAYVVSSIKLSENTVLLSLQTEHFIFTSIHPLSVSPDILYDMLRVARSTKIDRELILAAYSKREVIDFKTQSLNMFAQSGPESGTIVDMIKQDDDITFDENYYEGFDENAPLNENVEGVAIEE